MAPQIPVAILAGFPAQALEIEITDNALRNLPVKRIKIDRSFIVELPESKAQRAVVEAIVTLSRVRHLAITVQGIERAEQAELLQPLGCHEGQGDLFAPPLPFDALLQRLRT